MLKSGGEKVAVWSNPLIALLAVAGALLGFAQTGSLMAGMFASGGSAFLLVYLVALLLFGLPIMMAWLYLGRQAAEPAQAVIEAVRASKLHRFWGWLGAVWQVLAFLLLVLLLSWAGSYAPRALDAPITFGTQLGSLGVFVLLVMLLGVAGAAWLARVSALLVVIAVGLAVIMLLQVSSVTVVTSSLRELFAFRPDLLHWSGVLHAMQLALVGASLGGAALWVYGHYLPSRPTSLASWATSLLLLEMALALFLGTTEFVVASDVLLDRQHSLYLLLPPLGALIAALALAEAVTVRLTAAGLRRTLAWLVVLLVAGALAALGMGVLPALQAGVMHVALPLSTLLLALLVGWMLKETQVRKVWAVEHFPLYLALRALLRLLVPLVTLVLLVHEVRLW